MAENPIKSMLRSVRDAVLRRVRSRRHRGYWDARWADPSYAPPWLGRGVSPEIVAAVEEGWLRPGSAVLDVGCGQGEVCGWFAQHGFPATGIDISDAAIRRAIDLHRGLKTPASLTFEVHDICTTPLRRGAFHVIIDRGCLHQIPRADWPGYRKHLALAAADDARVMLFVKAFRDGVPYGDPAEIDRIDSDIREALAEAFIIESRSLTYLDANHGKDAKTALGGVVFRLRKTA